MLTYLYIVFCIVSGIYFFLTWNYKHWQKRGIPYPEPAVFVGNLPGAARQKVHITLDIEKIYNRFKGKYNFVGFFNLRQPQYLITDASLTKEVLINKFKNFQDNEFADMTDKEKDPIFGRNPFLLKGQEWKDKRSEISPAFTPLRLKAMYPVMEDVCERLKDYISRENHQAIEARDLSARFTADVVSSCIFGIDAKSFAVKKSPIQEMGRKILNFSPRILFYFFIVQMLPSLRKLYKITFVEKAVEAFFVNIMKDAIDLRKKSKIDRSDFLQYLFELQERKKLSELDMVAHAITFFLDGFDTSSVVLGFTLYELAYNKHVQDKLRHEIRQFTEKHGKIDFEITHEMPYLEQVLAETLRLHPPAFFLSKSCTQSCELPLRENQMMVVEEGYSVMIPIHSIHRDERYFEDPESFIPERFAPEKGGTKIHKEKGSFLPFGDGPRICLGRRFAETQIKAAIISIVRNFEITVNPKTPAAIVLDPKEIIPSVIGGVWLNYNVIKE